MFNRKKIITNLISLVMLVAALWGSVCIFRVLWGEDVWYDEIFSLVYGQKSLKEIVYLTGKDVHPPFYYFYLKGVISLFRCLPLGISVIQGAKIASFIPLIGMWGIAIFFVSRKYGLVSGSFFIMLTTIMPQLCNYYVEIRMYSLCLFMITCCFVGMISIFEGIYEENRKKVLLGTICVWFWGILCAYTQYFACVAVIGVYLTIIVYLFLSLRAKLSKLGISLILLAGVMSVLCYIPWLPYFFGQVSTVSGSYWIQPLTVRSIFGCIKFIYLPVSGDGVITYIAAGLMLLSTLIVFLMFLSTRPLKYEIFIGIAGMAGVSFVVLVGFILSIINRPIFVYRYMVPVLGGYYLSLAFMFGYALKRRGRLLLIIVLSFLLGGKLTFNGYNYEENYKLKAMESTMEELGKLEDESIIITNFDQVTCVIDYYCPNFEVYLYEGETDPAVQVMYDRDGQTLLDKDVEKLVTESIEGDKKVYFLGSFNSREEICKDFGERGIQSEEKASILLERYWVNIYELGLK